ncbi:Uncharacterized protein SCF082_LOCUS50752 [Durusdinium trenchii]|uniref:BTB domain-containing protein n=1 Tax=Durusdinium trenchii TaxID=1381693 RepID=A0ABP0SA34_9DINO
MYFIAVALSFALCASLFLLSIRTGALVEQSCSRISFFHHVVAAVLGAWAHWCYQDHLEEAAFGANDRFPVAVLLQHFNLGYFLYDTVHVAVWDQKFLEHHLIAMAGYATSELANVFGLANAVNTWITEVGSLMYSAYLIKRSDSLYLAFVICYTLSRLYFAYWSLVVLGQVWHVLREGPGTLVMPFWAPYCAASLQVLLFGVNATFVATHWKKLLKRYSSGKGTVTGLLEDVQCLRQRLDVLDQRRIEPKDTDKRFNELAAQIQALEHQGRLSQAAWDESQRRQAARQRRWEQNLEELHTRIAAGEMANRGSRSNLALPEHFEARVRKLEQRQDYSESALTTLQMQVQEGLQAVNLTGDEDESMSERGLMALERKTSGQIQDLSSAVAGLRVRVDGQLQRMGSLAERLEAERSASPKGLALLRGELAQQVQEQQQYVTEMAVLRSKMQDFAECYDDSLADIKEARSSERLSRSAFFNPRGPQKARASAARLQKSRPRAAVRAQQPPALRVMPEPTRPVCAGKSMEQLKIRLKPEQPSVNLGEDLRGLFQTCQFFDIALVVETMRFPAHKAVVASLSGPMQEFLRKSLGGEQSWAFGSVDQLPALDLEVSEPKAVLILLDFAYNLGGAFEIDFQVVREVLHLVKVFELPDLEIRVVDSLAQQVAHENMLEILAIAVEFDLIGLYNHAFKILRLSGYLKEMSQSEAIRNYPHLMQHMLLHFSVQAMQASRSQGETKAELACVLGQVPQVPYGSEMLQLSQLQAEQGQLIPLEGLVPDANTQPSTTCYEVQSNSSEELFHYPPGLEVNGTLGDVQAFYGEGPADSDSDDSMAGHLAPPETAPELHLLAGHLLAADALAARVVELERYAGQSNAEGPMSTPETLSPLQVKLYRLSNEVGELQARLLSLRLQRELQAEAMLAEEMSDSALDLHGQAQDLRHLEEQVVELEQAFLPDQEPELLEDHGGEDTGLAELAERLEPLERAFRLVAERLKSLSPHEFLPSLVNGHGGGLEQLLAKVDNLELSPELEEKLRQIDAREEQDVAKAATNHVQDVQTLARQVSTYEEDLANVKLQTNGITKEVESLRADVEDLQALMRKATSVDGSSVSPLTKARGKLDLLCAQMAELQSRMRDAGPQQQKYYQERCSATRGEDEPEVGPGPRTAGFGGSPLRAQM